MAFPKTQIVYKRPESVLVVIHAASSVLLLKRVDMPNFWQSVTGSLNHDESDARICALRELEEETGLTSDDGTLSAEHGAAWFEIYPERLPFYAPGILYNYEHVFTFSLPEPKNIRLSDEHSEYCWVTKKESLARIVSLTNKQAVQEYVPD